MSYPYREPVPTHFVAGPQLNARVSERFARPAVMRIQDALADAIRRNAPDAALWMSARDERVRPTHVEADGQTVPDNLRYVLTHPSTGGHELARAPRDPDLSVGNRINCRCISAALVGAIAERVAKGDVQVVGPRVRATVSVSYPRVVESEHPGPDDGGGGWVRQAIVETAARIRTMQR